MADICVIYSSQARETVEKLVALLRRRWVVWWDGDLYQGSWEKAVRQQIGQSSAVVPVFSANSDDKPIFRDELSLARKLGRLIFPFFIDDVEPPLGFGDLSRTNAHGWRGDDTDLGYRALVRKIEGELRPQATRVSTLQLNAKSLRLPAFMFSLSSHETQVAPKDGIKLLDYLRPAASLISAYDVAELSKEALIQAVKPLLSSQTVVALDSGNYEAYRKGVSMREGGKGTWEVGAFRRVASLMSPDIAFHFDEPDPEGGMDEIAERVISRYLSDKQALSPNRFLLCPIVHLPTNNGRPKGIYLGDCASRVITKVVKELEPFMVAIPERELGDGLIERAKNVKIIRKSLNTLGVYYPLHLLGTGNPISMTAFAVAGADSFDGLEWCRVIADYENGFLFHFQHFDCFKDRYAHRLGDVSSALVQDPQAAYVTKALSYNVDFFNNWVRTIQELIGTGQEEYLMRTIPNIGDRLHKELASV